MHMIMAILLALVVAGVVDVIDERSLWTVGKALYVGLVAGFLAWWLTRGQQ